MLRLLDGDTNVKGSPNENYAREFLELYTIGRGLEGSLPSSPESGDYVVFSEQDVQAAAKVLSGWDVLDWDAGEHFFNVDPDTDLPKGKVKGNTLNASAHDNDAKVFSARFASASIQPDPNLLNAGSATEESAIDEIRQLVNLLYAKPETAKNICWKIYRFYVYAPHTTEHALVIDEAVISEMARTFVSNNYKLQPVIENLLCSQHFFDAGTADGRDDNYGGIIKSPIDLVIGTLRFFSVPLPDMATETETFYESTGNILSLVQDMGMNFYDPYDVAGYDAYHQFPVYHRSWITPNYLARRYAFIREIITASENGVFNVNVFTFVKNNFPDAVAANAGNLIIDLAKYVFPLNNNLTFDETMDENSALTAKRLNYFKDRFLQQFDEAYWSTRWTNGSLDLRDQLEFLFNAMLQSPENQLA
jgi:uncharacterized protein (DUF1800 family)